MNKIKTRKRRSSILKESNEQAKDVANVTFPIRRKRVSWAPDDVRLYLVDTPDQNTPEGKCLGGQGEKKSKFCSVSGSSSYFESVEEESFKMQGAEKPDRNGLGSDNNASMDLTCVGDPNDSTLTDETVQQGFPSSVAAGDVTVFDNSNLEMTCVQDTSAASLGFLDDVSDMSHVKEQISFMSSGKDSFEESSPPTKPSESEPPANAPVEPASVLAPSLYRSERNDDKTTCSMKSMDLTNLLQPNCRKLNQCDDDSFTLAPTNTSGGGCQGRKSFADATTYSCIAMNETNVMSESSNVEMEDADELAYLETVVGGMEFDNSVELACQGREEQCGIKSVSMAEVSSSANTSTLKPAQELSHMEISVKESSCIKSPAKTPVRKEALDSSKTSIVPSNIESPAKTPVSSFANTSTLKPAQELSHTEMLESFLEPVDIKSPAKTPVSSSVNTSTLKPAQELSHTEMLESFLEPVEIESPAKTPVRKEALDSSKTSIVPSNIESPAKTPVSSSANTSTLKPAQELSHTEMLESFLEPVDITSPAKTPVRKEALDSSKTSIVPSNIESPAKTPVSSFANTSTLKSAQELSHTEMLESFLEPVDITSPAKTPVRKETLDSSKTSIVPSNIEAPANTGLSTSLKWGQAANESSTSIQAKQGITNSPLSMSTMNFSCSDLMLQSFSCSMNEDVSAPQVSSKVDVDTFFGSIAPELSSFVTNWDENFAENWISNTEKLIGNPLEKKVFKETSSYLLEEMNKMKFELSALKERFNENNPDIVNEYRFNQSDETKQKLKEIISQCKNKTKDYMEQIEEKLVKLCSSTVNKELFAEIQPFVDEMESALPNLHSLCDDLMKKVDNERKDIKERMKKIWGNQTPPSKDELEKAFHLLTCIENLRKGNAEVKENEEQWNYLMKRQTRILDECNQFCTLVKNEEKYRKMILDKANHNELYQLYDVVEKSRTKWVYSYMKNSLIFTAAFDQENPTIVTEYSLKSNIKDNYSVPECDIKLYELAHEIVKYKMDFTAPPSYPVSLGEKLLVSSQVEVNVSRAIELNESIIQSTIEYMGKIKLTWKENDVVEARIKGSNIFKRLTIRFIFVERSETGQVKSANFLPISFKIVQNNTSVSQSFVSGLLKEATSREHVDPTLFRRLILHKLHLECSKSTP